MLDRRGTTVVPTKYILYIDILGFSDLVKRDSLQVEKIYGVLDSLNVHRHDVFRTIVFSDTVLVYNRIDPESNDAKAHEYIVWYSIEFAEDLHHRLTGQGLYFRAVLVSGEFQHYALKNIDCFFGEALIDAYVREKTIPSIGLFIDTACNQYNRYFRTEPFGNDLHFVYLNRSVESLQQETNGELPVDKRYFIIERFIKVNCEQMIDFASKIEIKKGITRYYRMV